MAIMTLMRAQKNKFFEILEDFGLSEHIGNFKWKKLPYRYNFVSVLEYRLDKEHLFFFRFIPYENRRWGIKYYPRHEHDIYTNNKLSWGRIIKEHFPHWAGRLAQEVLVPNLWAEIGKATKRFNLVGQHSSIKDTKVPKPGPASGHKIDYWSRNERITKKEAANIRSKLKTLEKEVFARYTLPEQEIDRLKKELSYLKDAVNRLGRIDWIHTAIGVFTTIAASVLVSAGNNKDFVMLINKLFGDSIKYFLGN